MKQLLIAAALILLTTASWAGNATIDRTEDYHIIGSDWFQIPESITAKGDNFIVQDRTGDAKIEVIWDGNTSAANGLAILPGRSLGINATVVPMFGVHVKVSADSTTNAAQIDFVLQNNSFF